MKLAPTTPSPTPTTTQGDQAFRMRKSTAPRRAWAWTERSDVITMVASDVPTATCIVWSPWPTPIENDDNTATIAGTTTKPPPMPSSPAMKPASRPDASIASSGGAN